MFCEKGGAGKIVKGPDGKKKIISVTEAAPATASASTAAPSGSGSSVNWYDMLVLEETNSADNRTIAVAAEAKLKTGDVFDQFGRPIVSFLLDTGCNLEIVVSNASMLGAGVDLVPGAAAIAGFSDGMVTTAQGDAPSTIALPGTVHAGVAATPVG